MTTTPRYMYDATHVEAPVLKALNPEMVAIYLTGSADIRWTPADVAQFPGVRTWVRIDQGGPTSPQYEANVADVESGAWTVANAQSEFLPKCTAPRPTLYVNRSTLPSVTAKCDLWVAAPGLSDAEARALAATDSRIVAVQNLWNNNYDRSIVIDPYWPAKKPVTPPPPPPPAKTVTIEYYKPKFGWVAVSPLTIPADAPHARYRIGNGPWVDVF